MNFTFKDSKSEKQLAYSFKILVNPKNYFVPRTIEEYKKVDYFWSPRIKINSHEWFFSEKSKNELKQFVSCIYSIDDIQNTVIYNTVYQSTIREIEIEIISKLESKPLRDFQEVLSAIFVRISEEIKRFDFFFPLEGLDLESIKEVDFGDVKIIQFDEELRSYIYSHREQVDKNEYLDEHILRFIDKNLLKQVVIKCSTFGDFEKAQELARFRAREVINYFRYLICVLGHERIYENLIKIDILSQAYIQGEDFLARNTNNGSIIIVSGAGRKNLEKFPINEERLRELKEKAFFDDIVGILNSKERTELEGCIITAIYWTGEAQNEFDWDVAFLKYWTALESIFSYKKEEITHSLAKGVSVLLAFGAYRFIEINDVKQVYKKISKLYKLRSKIIHRGLRENISELELSEICKYTSWVILSLLDLRTKGYTKLEEIDGQTTRLYDILNREEKQSIIAVAAEIQEILEEVSKLYSTDTISGKMAVATEAVQRIESDPTLMQKILSALKPGQTQVLARFLNHPVTSFVIVALEELQKKNR
jgi:sulfur transfer complex TusBCD TusB component (DsrH family)